MATLEPLVRVTGTATPLPLDSIDTDVITPMHRVMDGTIVEHAFEALRAGPDGSPLPNPFDDPRHADDQILVAGANFGCGSSRETAVWAIKGMGYRVVIAESFGDIFYANCFKNAVLPVVLDRAEVQHLIEVAAAGTPVTVDLPGSTVTTAERTFRFSLPELRRTALLEGLDDLDLALRMDERITAFEDADRARRPWAHLEP
jgi:3-isopropylmalate/(R)-2-methylmalate dehydratase small subunit